MTLIRGGTALRDVRVLFRVGSYGGLTDGELLERFVLHPEDEAGERAFAALVDRHGPMVLRVGRGVLRDPNDVEDVFQATFLVLARKAGSLWVRDSIGPWLHGVAYRVARRAQADSDRRRRHERSAAERATTVELDRGLDDEVGLALHEEIERLPARFRDPLVLCHFEGLTHDQAALRLGWPVGTVRSRLARGRDRLRKRLDERGVASASGLLPAAVATGRTRAVQPAMKLNEITIQAATRFATGQAAAGVAPAVVALTRGILRSMFMKTLIKVAAVLAVAGCAATGAAGFAMQEDNPGRGGADDGRLVAAATAATAAEDQPKSEAERIAEKILKAGSDLFDAKKAEALAATYTEDGEVHMISKRDGETVDDVKQGRAEIEQLYRDQFREAGTIDSENYVQFARLIAPDLLVIHGRFRPDTGRDGLPFVQMRVKEGDKWLLKTLWLFISPDEQ